MISEGLVEGGAGKVILSRTRPMFSGDEGRAGRRWGPVDLVVSIMKGTVVIVVVEVLLVIGIVVVIKVVVVADLAVPRFGFLD